MCVMKQNYLNNNNDFWIKIILQIWKMCLTLHSLLRNKANEHWHNCNRRSSTRVRNDSLSIHKNLGVNTKSKRIFGDIVKAKQKQKVLSDYFWKKKRQYKKQRRVWSWLRMNASGRLNTCKSRGSVRVSNNPWRRPAQGCVTREQLALIRGITGGNAD